MGATKLPRSFLVVSCLLLAFSNYCTGQKNPKNVLFLVVDDLRPELGVYYDPNDEGSQIFPEISTPNIDSLAGESLLLKNAFTQFSVCCPSRSSYMTSRRPDTTKVYDKVTYWRESGGDITTIPQFFKDNGYTSVGMGKIYHPGADTGSDDPPSWSDDYSYYHASKNGYSSKDASWEAVSATVEARKPLPDRQLADEAIRVLDELAEDTSTPFFLAVGFYKPHLPFVCPQEYFDLYPEANIDLVNNPDPPSNLPGEAWHTYSELTEFDDITAAGVTGDMGSQIPDNLAKELRRAYYACVSYVDGLIGDVLEKLDSLNLKEDTVVTLVGDHGWQLGEHGEWTKNTNFDVATRVPMMIRIPGVTDNGLVSDKLVELVHLFPTLVEAVGFTDVTIDQCPADSPRSSSTSVCTEGSSMMSLITDGEAASWKGSIFTQMGSGRTMGYSIRTSEYRYTEWLLFVDDTPFWNRVKAVELYDYALDPAENSNRASEDEYQDVVLTLSEQLQNGWYAALPSSASKRELATSKASSLRSLLRNWLIEKLQKKLERGQT